jgi:hypothetical protein
VLPWMLLGSVIAVAGAYWYGTEVGYDQAIGEQARDVVVAQIAADAATLAVADGLSQLKVVNRTIHNEVQRDVIEKPVYRDVACRHDPASLRRINAALTGVEAGPAGGGELPAADATGRPIVRRDDAEAGGGGQPVPRVPESGAATD